MKGGKTATSVAEKLKFASSRVHASFWTRVTASAWLRFIFQLPAMRGYVP